MTRHGSRRLGAVAIAGLLLVVGAAGCGDDDEQTTGGAGSEDESSDTTAAGDLYGGETGSGGGAASESGTITIESFAFPDTVETEAGATVAITNKDGETHTVTADDGAFDVTANAGQEAVLTAPSEPGEYAFHCSIHPSMTSTLIVT